MADGTGNTSTEAASNMMLPEKTTRELELERMVDQLKQQVDELRRRPSPRAEEDDVGGRDVLPQGDMQLQREIGLLRREMEIMRREAALGSTTELHPISEKVSLRDVESTLPRFNGEDPAYPVKIWLETMSQLAKTYKWSTLDTYVAAKRAMDGAAKAWMERQTSIATWEALKQALEESFKDREDERAIHELLAKKRKLASESMLEYIEKMMTIGYRGRFSERTIISYIIDGIPDDVSRKVMLYGAATQEELKARLVGYEQVRATRRETAPTGKPRASTSGGAEPLTRKPVKCFNCGEAGHISRRCPHQGKKCFKCGKFGHIAPQCTERSSSSRDEVESQKRVLRIGTGQRKSNLKIMQIDGQKVECLVDSGADCSVIREDLLKELGNLRMDTIREPLTAFGGETYQTLGRVQATVNIDGVSYNLTFRVVPKKSIPKPVILGIDMLKYADVLLTQGEPKILPLEGHILQVLQEECSLNDALGGLEQEHADEIEKIIATYDASQEKEEVPVKMRIRLKDETPICQRPRRLSPMETKEVQQQVDEWLRDGTIRVSTSEFASPVVVARKKDGTARLCIDYRKLNKVIAREHQPLPLIEDVMDQLSKGFIFSTLDLKNGFFHIQVEEESRKYTSFVTPDGQYEFCVAPFGLCLSPPVFVRYVAYVFRELVRQGIVRVYMDDVIIIAEDEDQGLERLQETLKIAARFRLQVNWKKCQFLRRRVEFLGYVVEGGTIKPSASKTEAVTNFPEPKTVRQLQRFLGLTSYFRKFIEGYAKRAKPLSDLLKKDAKYVFGQEQRQAFMTLKSALAGAPILQLYQPGRETELHTDASQDGYGAILFQKNEETGLLHPVYYMSRKTTEAERKRHSYELEILAVVQAVKKFHVYLQGIYFKIVTDCTAFRQTMDKAELSPKVARWMMLLREYDHEIVHRAGTQMRHVDALSRATTILVIRDELVERIRLTQQRDDRTRVLTKLLERDVFEDYAVNNGLLYKGVGDQAVLVIPKSMQAEIIRRAHERAHFGVKKTMESITKEYWIDDLQRKVENFIRSCVTCILGDRKQGKAEGLLNPIPKGDLPLHTLHMDHMGPLKSSAKNYNHILVIIDAFTKFVWIFPVKSTGTGEVLQKLRIHQQTFGNPKRIITDRGTAFTAKEFKRYCEEEGIQHLTITTGVPRGNGQVERINAIIIAVLTKLSVEQLSRWYRHVGRVQQAINSTYQRAIGTSPFELFFGALMRLSDDPKLTELKEQEVRERFEQARVEARERARQQIEKLQEENKRAYDKHRKEARSYRVGDLVAIKRTQQGPGLKLAIRFLGPYEITKVGQKDRYEVKKISGDGPNETSCSADHMKPWKGLSKDSFDDVYSEDSDSAE